MFKFIILTMVLSLAMAWGATNAAELKLGDDAPAFSLHGSDGKTHSLKDFRGKQMIVLAWFPKAFTGG